jgi:hypothetical protein
MVRARRPELLSLNIEQAAAQEAKADEALRFAEFEREVKAEMKRRNLDPLSESDRAEAWKRVAKLRPDLVPSS